MSLVFLGRELQLYCEKHDWITEVSNLNDFYKVSQGGCNTPCAELMKCGHTCPSICHKIEHNEIRCHEPCPKYVRGSINPSMINVTCVSFLYSYSQNVSSFTSV